MQKTGTATAYRIVFSKLPRIFHLKIVPERHVFSKFTGISLFKAMPSLLHKRTLMEDVRKMKVCRA